MAMTPRLDLRQSQTLVMTPQLQQAIKLLQLNNIELSDYVEEELQQNPLLELDEGSARGERDRTEGTDLDEPVADPNADQDFDTDGFQASDSGDMDLSFPEATAVRETQNLDVDVDNMFNNDSNTDIGPLVPGGQGLAGGGAFDGGTGGSTSFDGPDNDIAQTLSDQPSLRRHLLEQISIDIAEPQARIIAAHLMELLDEAGYLSGEIERVAEVLNCSLEEVERVLLRMQQFDPPGIFARNLKECLAAQLRDLNRLDPIMSAFLDHLDLLGNRDITGLMRACGTDREDILDMAAEIRTLNPRPASLFDGLDVVQPVVPDVLMRAGPGGGWLIELNTDTLPRVLVNNQYYAQIAKTARSKDEKHYIADCLQSANWLVKSLHQRATTILKVATEIIRQQDEFFIKGVQYLRPLVLRDIAEVIGMHESTVSRVTSNKYMATPRGIFELKYFFTPALSSSQGGDSHSAEAVRHRIKALIDAEDPKKILSDDKIADILQKDGIDIARRTVAKYREALGISSSVQRRREKSMAM